MIKILLDTNIIIYRESDNSYKENIGDLYKIIDNSPDMFKYINKYIIEEISKTIDGKKRDIWYDRLTAYNILNSSKISENLVAITSKLNKDDNDEIDDYILNDVYTNKVDYLITEDKKIKEKAILLNIGDKVLSIREFIFKNKDSKIVNHDILDIFRVKFGELDINDSFFDSLKKDYTGFVDWFTKKKDEYVFCYKEQDKILGLLFLKNENSETEDYSDIKPKMKQNRKLKISTFKVDVAGKKIGERFMKIVFDQAIFSMVDEIYVTIYNNDERKENLIRYFEKFGFKFWGKKGNELVYVRDMKKRFDSNSPLKSYPYIKRDNDSFVIPIKPKYHTFLLPDSILQREEYESKHMPVEYAVNKYYVTNSGWLEKPKVGDNIIFYRSSQEGAIAKYSSVLTTIGIVTNIIVPKDVTELIKIVSNKTAYSEEELIKSFNKNTYVIEFAYITTLKRKLIYNECHEKGILDSFPRGVLKIDNIQFRKILELGKVDTNLIIK